MKIVVFTQVVDTNDPILGFMHRWLLEFAKHCDELHVITFRVGQHTLPANVTVHSMGKERGVSKWKQLTNFYRSMHRVRQGVNPDYVLYHMGDIFNILAAPFFWTRKNTKYYWWKAHGHINWRGRLALCFVDRVYTSTETGFPIASKKRRVIGQAIDTTLFVPTTESCSPAMVYVGRVMPVKKLEQFIETYARLRKSYPSLTARIIGPLDDQKYHKQLCSVCDELGVTHDIFVGPRTQEELVEEYQHATVFLNTSVTNSMDKTVLEAVLCGCVPVTGNKAFSELLADTDWYVADCTVESYVSAVDGILSKQSHDQLNSIIDRVRAEHSLETLPSRIFGKLD